MILDICSKINQNSIVLASKSPRRRELLGKIGLAFTCEVTNAEENAPKDDPKACVLGNAAIKAEAINSDADLVIASDTVVAFGGRVYEKPNSVDEAISFLTSFSGKWHNVHTGLVLQLKNADPVSFVETTRVKFNTLPAELIEAYANTDEPYDKAGAYGIQGTGATFVEEVNGCYFNVMGFPLHRFCSSIRQLHTEGKL